MKTMQFHGTEKTLKSKVLYSLQSIKSLLVFAFCFCCFFSIYSPLLPVPGKIAFSQQSSIPFPASPTTIPTNLSHIVFGISGLAYTWDRQLHFNELWWRPGEMRGYVWLDKEPAADATWPETGPLFRVSTSNSSHLGNGRNASAARIARIVVDSYQAVLTDPNAAEVRWFVVGDDDTVFFPENLLAVLRKYDHRQMYYVGSMSESVEQDLEFSYNMAFHGAGFAITYPAAMELARIIDGCLDRYSHHYSSDHLIQSCLSELGVPLTQEPGFHQIDLHEDAHGMLAVHPVVPLVSLHNLNYIKPISPHYKTQHEAVKSLVDVSCLDPGRTLQQCICYERGPGFIWSVSVSWGYSVQLYPWAVAPKDLVKALTTFRSWRTQSLGPFTLDTRQLNLDWPCDLPVLFFLNHAARDGVNWNWTTTEYSRDLKQENGCKSPSSSEAFKVKTVRVKAPQMAPAEWKRAPRRQCCKTVRIEGGEILLVQINQCKPGQSSLSQ
ncbi:fringe-like protein (DUF604) [Rhynchospora pubera]|uniref:Fringe-like protein (DUF604) n=1 Tax=Rhynchospora pubera TaxID=906938 RepID=A0AAV8CP01_9POAL|nr:fringe-like protein (DUF604) [Rhynchospora pubera]